MYEHHRQPVLERSQFVRRVARHGVVSCLLVAFSLSLGTIGYHAAAGLDWIDAFLNASMILTGMGPVNELGTPAAKIFAALYALYSGVVFLVAAGVLLAPALHRMMHRLHVEG
jgi:hypothetical protein